MKLRMLNRACTLGFFCPKQGQGFKPSAAHLAILKYWSSSPPPPPPRVHSPLFTIFTKTIMYLVYPQKFCIAIVSNLSWVLQSSQEKSKTMATQNLGGKQGALWSMWKVSRWLPEAVKMAAWSACSRRVWLWVTNQRAQKTAIHCFSRY